MRLTEKDFLIIEISELLKAKGIIKTSKEEIRASIKLEGYTIAELKLFLELQKATRKPATN